MTITALVSFLTGGGATIPSPTPTPTPSGGGIKEWIKGKLEGLAKILKSLAEKAAVALPGIIGSIISWILTKAEQAVGWLANNIWALVVLIVTTLLAILNTYINKPRQPVKRTKSKSKT